MYTIHVHVLTVVLFFNGMSGWIFIVKKLITHYSNFFFLSMQVYRHAPNPSAWCGCWGWWWAWWLAWAVPWWAFGGCVADTAATRCATPRTVAPRPRWTNRTSPDSTVRNARGTVTCNKFCPNISAWKKTKNGLENRQTMMPKTPPFGFSKFWFARHQWHDSVSFYLMHNFCSWLYKPNTRHKHINLRNVTFRVLTHNCNVSTGWRHWKETKQKDFNYTIVFHLLMFSVLCLIGEWKCIWVGKVDQGR